MDDRSECPSGLCLPSGLGMYTRRTGCGSIRLLPEFFRQFVQPAVHAVRLDVLERLAVDPRRAVVGTAAVVGELPGRRVGTPCRTARRTDSRAISSLWRATPPGASQPSVEVIGSRQSPGCRSLRDVDLELRPLPSTGVTRLRRYYGPLRHPRRPGLSLAGVRLRVTRPHRLGFPVLRWISVCRHAVVITPVGPLGRDRSWDGLFQPFPCSPATAAFPVYVAGRLPHWIVSRPARRSLALRPAGSLHRRAVPLSRRLRRFRYLHRRSDSYRLERPSCRVGIAPN